MWNTLLEAGGKPDNKVTINAGFWNFVPFIAFAVLLAIWIITAKLIERRQKRKKDNTNNQTENNIKVEEHN